MLSYALPKGEAQVTVPFVIIIYFIFRKVNTLDFKSHFFLCFGMIKGKRAGSKKEGLLLARLCSVASVGDERQASRCKLYSYLMGSARVKLYADKRAVDLLFYNRVFKRGVFDAFSRLALNDKGFVFRAVVEKHIFKYTVVIRRYALDEREIFLFKQRIAYLRGKRGGRGRRFGIYHQPRGFSVEPVYAEYLSVPL